MSYVRNIELKLSFEEIQDIIQALRFASEEAEGALETDSDCQLREYLRGVLTEANGG